MGKNTNFRGTKKLADKEFDFACKFLSMEGFDQRDFFNTFL